MIYCTCSNGYASLLLVLVIQWYHIKKCGNMFFSPFLKWLTILWQWLYIAILFGEAVIKAIVKPVLLSLSLFLSDLIEHTHYCLVKIHSYKSIPSCLKWHDQLCNLSNYDEKQQYELYPLHCHHLVRTLILALPRFDKYISLYAQWALTAMLDSFHW